MRRSFFIKNDVSRNHNLLLLRTPKSVCLRGQTVSYKDTFTSFAVKFATKWFGYMCIAQTPKNAKVAHIGFNAIPLGVRSVSMQRPARNAIENMDIGVDRLSPKLKRH